MDWGRMWLVDFHAGKTQVLSFDWSNSPGVIDVKLCRSILKKKSSFKMLGLTSCKLDCGSYIIPIAKTVSEKIEALSCSIMKFLSLEVTLYIYIYHTAIHEILSCLSLCF